jgi:cytochrome P450 family 130
MAIAFDPWEPANFQDPYPLYRRLLEEDPVPHNEARAFWALTRFEDVWDAHRDWRTYSSAEGIAYSGNPVDARRRAGTPSLIDMDPPKHTRLRALVSRAFTQRAMAAMENRVRELAQSHLDAMLERPDPDFGRDVAVPVPGLVIAEMLGVPRDDVTELVDWSVTMTRIVPDDPASLTAAGDAMGRLNEYFAAMVGDRRVTPTDDLVSGLVSAQDGGEVLTDGEIVGFARSLFNAGHGTTTTFLCDAVVALARFPEQRARLVADPELLPSAVEEMVRFCPPVHGVFHTTTREVEVRGVTIPAAAKVLLLFAAAGRDPRVFADPDALDVGRRIERQLGFGVGPHHCIGAHLARLESRIVLEELLRRAPDYEVVGEPRHHTLLAVRRLESVPLGAPTRG